MRQIRIEYNQQGQTIETYLYTQKQAIAVGAKLDNTKLIQLVNKLEELSKSSTPINQDMNILTQTIATAVTTSMVQILPKLIQPQETELDKERKKLEIEKLQLKKINMVAKLSNKYKLEQLGNLEDIPTELVKNMKQLAGTVIKEVRPNISGISLTACLKQVGLNIRAKKFYIILMEAKIVEPYEYKTVRGIEHKWKLTEAGLYYGYNQHSSSLRELPYNIKFYFDRFGELLDLLRNLELL